MKIIRNILLVALFTPLLALAADKTPLLEPLPEALPPPTAKDLDKELKETPEITVRKKGRDKVEEYRIHGDLYMMKITPPHGKPYYLYKEDQNGAWERFDGVTPPVSVPKWILFHF